MSSYTEYILKLEQKLNELENKVAGMTFHPELKGILVAKYVTCGRHDCNCITVGERHGPYFYIQYKKDNKTKFSYLDAAKATKLKPLYDENKTYKKAIAKINKLKRELAHTRKLERREMKNG